GSADWTKQGEGFGWLDPSGIAFGQCLRVGNSAAGISEARSSISHRRIALARSTIEWTLAAQGTWQSYRTQRLPRFRKEAGLSSYFAKCAESRQLGRKRLRVRTR